MVTRKAIIERLKHEIKLCLKLAMSGCGDLSIEQIDMFCKELKAARELAYSDNYIDINEACSELGGISHATFYNWIGRGRLPEGKKKREVVVWNKKDIENAKQYMK